MGEIKKGISPMVPKLSGRMQEIPENIDSGSENIDYKDFLAATMERSLILKEEKLWKAMKELDSEGSEKISPEELKLVIAVE